MYNQWQQNLQCLKSNTKVKKWLYCFDQQCKNVEDYKYHLYKVSKAAEYKLVYRDREFIATTPDIVELTEGSYVRSKNQCEQLLVSVQRLAKNYLDEKYEDEYNKFNELKIRVEERTRLIDANVYQNILEERKGERHAAVESERTRESKLYHNFTSKVFTEEEEVIMHRSAGDVIRDSGKLSNGDLPVYVTNILEGILLRYCRHICGEKRGDLDIKSRITRSEIVRYLSHPEFTPRQCNFVDIVWRELLSSISSQKLDSFKSAVEERKREELQNNLASLRSREGVIIRESDKRLGFSVNSCEWYTNEYKRQLDTPKYTQIECITGIINAVNNLGVEYGRDLIQLLYNRDVKSWVTEKDREGLQNYKRRKISVPYMNLLPKVHKLVEPAGVDSEKLLTGRPIITAFAWYNVELSKLLQRELNAIIQSFKDHMMSLGMPNTVLVDSAKYMLDVGDLLFPTIGGHFFVTYDFKDLYTNVLYESFENSLKSVCEILKLPESRSDSLLNMYSLYCKYNYFRVGDELYQQLQGISMGSYCSVEVSNLVLLHSEYEFFLSIDIDSAGVLLLYRYIDDGSIIAQIEELAKLKEVLLKLFMFYPSNLEITVSISRVQFVFLDQKYTLDDLSVKTGHLHRTVYFKPYHTFGYVSFASNHNKRILANLVKNECIRYARICTDEKDFLYVRRLFRIRMRKLGYRTHFLNINVVNYNSVSRITLKFKGSLDKKAPSTNDLVLAKVLYDKRYRIGREIKKIIHRASVGSGLNVRVKMLHCLQPKLREILSTRRELHKALAKSQKLEG